TNKFSSNSSDFRWSYFVANKLLLIKHLLNDHMEELSYDNILDLIKMKEKIDKVITSIDENL
ncbi:hypothetical protein, partial [uncultured Fusobacterium sp.]|uniref:hypothetical protein n=1 Tax=uncultured Fusobacterium sp. TaxID=159267 RepID=UPI0025FA987F